MINCENDNRSVSTHNNRSGPSTGSTALCSMLRMGMRVSPSSMRAPFARTKSTVRPMTSMLCGPTYAEIPVPTGMTAWFIPVLEATIANSRAGARRSPPSSSGGYLHTCSNIVLNDDACRIESIQGLFFDPDKSYLGASNSILCRHCQPRTTRLDSGRK
jgi:hypothetical protein